jgi:Fe-S cluster assembly ATPase SufC
MQRFLDRSVNEGFSGGEKKRNEILQMALLNPPCPFWMKRILAWTLTR